MNIGSTEIAAASRLFSSAVFKELAQLGRSPAFARIVRQLRTPQALTATSTVADTFDRIFAMLRLRGLRDEYVYKAALTQKVLLGTHSLNTASMLNEFRVGYSKADLVILNGTATAYEVKSERDSLARLPDQLFDYRRAFARVFIITSECHVERAAQIAPDDVGILSLSPRHQISEIRPAAHAPERICPATVFESLRTHEAQRILRSLGQEIPLVPNTRMRLTLREQFKKMEPVALHSAMVAVLKRTRSLQPLEALIGKLPSSLHAAALTYPLRRHEHDRLVHAIQTPLLQAKYWA